MRREASQPVEDVDVTHRRVLNWLLLARGVTPKEWDDGVRKRLVGAWHDLRGECWWGFESVVFAWRWRMSMSMRRSESGSFG